MMLAMDWRAAMWEGVARDILESTGCDDPPVDAHELAELCGLEVRPTHHRGGHLLGRTIFASSHLSGAHWQAVVAHELGHWALRRAGEQDNEVAADYVGAALLLPRGAFSLDLRRVGWSLPRLHALHPNAPALWILRRICHLRPAVGLLWERGRVVERPRAPGAPEAVERPTAAELWMVSTAARTGRPVRLANNVSARPLGPDSAIAVAEVEALAEVQNGPFPPG